MLDLKRILASKPQEHEPQPFEPLATPWSEALDPESVLPEHPRPQFARSSYLALHGRWEYAITPAWITPSIARAGDAPERFDGSILVPFSPEAPLSGVERQLQPGELLWYRLRFEVARPPHIAVSAETFSLPAIVSAFGSMLAIKAGQRCLLHFDGVDHACAFWVNGMQMAVHEGAYQPFSVDITDELNWGENELLVCVSDPSDTGPQLRGKQKLQRGSIWYTAQSGIWQPVWMEAVPQVHVESLRVLADMHANLTIEIETNRPAPAFTARIFPRSCTNGLGEAEGNLALQAEREAPELEAPAIAPFAQARPQDFGQTARQASEERDLVRVTARIDPQRPRLQTAQIHVDDVQLWTPETPHLYAIEIRCGDDKVQTYCGFRTVEVGPDDKGVPRFKLNGKPYFLRGVLDQGYWPESMMTPPADAALVHDIVTVKDLGFNMLRKHLKVENERWYWHCDRLGMLVWQDMPSGGMNYDSWYTSHQPTLIRSSWTRQRDDTPLGRKRLSSDDPRMQQEWTATCRNAVKRLCNHPCIVTWVLFNEGWGQFDAHAATDMVRKLDPTRPIDATSGWYDQACGDYWSVHNYFRTLAVWPDQHASAPRAFVISEFGGLTLHVTDHSALELSYGYNSFDDPAQWRTAVRNTLAQADALEAKGLAGFVYTQLSDVEEETNGLLTYDRKVNKLAR